MNSDRFYYFEPINCIYDSETDIMYYLNNNGIYDLLEVINKIDKDLNDGNE